jgi:hypothetical protein
MFQAEATMGLFVLRRISPIPPLKGLEGEG